VILIEDFSDLLEASTMSWWKRLASSKEIERDAARYLKTYGGDRAADMARRQALLLRAKKLRFEARHYSLVALRIEEMRDGAETSAGLPTSATAEKVSP
jgi:hypothetical protein